MIIASVVNYSNFAYENKNSIYNGLVEIIVERPDNKNNTNVVNDLKDICKQIDSDVMYSTVGNKGTSRLFFKTSNHNDFLYIKTESGSQILKSGECLSTLKSVENYNVIPIYMSNMFGDTTVYPFEECVNYNLSIANFCIQQEAFTDFTVLLENKGYTVRENEMPIALGYKLYEMSDYILCPFIILSLSIFIYFMNDSKKHIVKKLNGYHSATIIFQEVFLILASFLLIFLTTQFINFALFYFLNNVSVTDYIIYTLNSPLCVWIGFVLIALLLASLLVIIHNKTEFVKGRKDKKLILCVITVTKVVVILFMYVPLMLSASTLPNIINIHRASVEVAEKTVNYVIPNVYGWYSETTNEKLSKFYKIAEKEFNGIYMRGSYNQGLIDSGNYLDNVSEFYQVEEGLTKEISIYLNLKSIYINSNYLSINPVHKPDGTLVTKNDFDDDKFNILVSENEKYVEYIPIKMNYCFKDILQKEYDGKTPEYNIIYYKDNEEFCMLNSDVDMTSDLYARNPIVFVSNGMLNKLEGVSTAFENNQFMLKTNTDSPYEEILPIIRECELEDVILDVSNSSEGFEKAIAFNLEIFVPNFIKFMMYMALYLFLMFFYVKTYLQNYKDDIAVKKLSGESFLKLHKRYWLTSLLMMLVIEIGIFILYMQNFFIDFSMVNVMIPIIIYLGEFVIFKIYSEVFVRKSIVKVLKGS